MQYLNLHKLLSLVESFTDIDVRVYKNNNDYSA